MKSRSSAGYTILEVLIVLTVTTGLFLSVAALLGGKQGQTELSQSVRDFESKLQGISNDVANGFYPNGFNCVANPGLAVTLSGAASGAGQNQGCIFLGKVMSFGATNVHIFTTVGRQFVDGIGSADVDGLPEAKPVAVAPPTGPNLTASYDYRYSLRVVSITKIDALNTPVGAIAFMSELGGGVSEGNPVTGSRSTKLYGITNTSTPNTDADVTIVSRINLTPNFYPINEGVRICLRGGNNQPAEITVGADGSQTTTFVNLDSGVSSVCS